MKRIAFFSIPAHGHTNPMLPVAAELVRRGDIVRFYSFNEFEDRIRRTGAEFISCDSYLPRLNEREEAALKKVSTTEMTIQDIRITLAMDSFFEEEFASFLPDVVYTDSVCFWGKLNAWKHNVPMVVSTSTFAFNQLSSKYMKNSPAEIADMIFGLPRIAKELKKLEQYGYHVKGVMSLVQSDNSTDSVIYTSRRFQPYAESFSDRYAFVGPSLPTAALPDKAKERPLVYISMGTVINDRPDFYSECISALKDMPVDVIISCGNSVDIGAFGNLPENIAIYRRVDQLDVLSKADVFITHCGMNSVSESLYMATPMVLYPQTSEQKAVATRVTEMNSGVILNVDSADGIAAAVMSVLDNPSIKKAAEECCADLRSCGGASEAADFIENAPHSSNGVDVLSELNRFNARFQIIYWLIAIAIICLFGVFIGWKYTWVVGILFGTLSTPILKSAEKKKYSLLIK